MHADACVNADRTKKSSLMTPRLCAFVLRRVCRIGEGSLEDETVLWSLYKKGM